MKGKVEEFLKQAITNDEYQELITDPVAYRKALELYSEEFVDSVIIVSINDTRFLIKKEEAGKLHKDWLLTLMELAEKESLSNPVYVDADEDGTLLID